MKHTEATKAQAPKEVPRLMIERDLKTGEFTVWNTQEHNEVFRGTREEAIQFEKVN